MPASKKLKLPSDPIARRIVQLVNGHYQGNVRAASLAAGVPYNQLWKVCRGYFARDVPLSLVRAIADACDTTLTLIIDGPAK